jgi:hypothetical protein
MRAPDSAASTAPPSASASTFSAIRSTPHRVPNIWLGIVLTLVVVVGQILTQAIDFGLFQLRIGVLNSNNHASIFGVASMAAQALAALAAAGRSRESRWPTGWIVLAALTGLLLVIRAGFSFHAVLLLGPVAMLFVLVWYLTSNDPRPARALVRAGLAALAFSYFVHVFGPHVVAALGYAGNTWPYQVKGMLKHSAELAGWLLVAIGVFQGRPRTGPPVPTADVFHPSEL